jgi:hypothetical protein
MNTSPDLSGRLDALALLLRTGRSADACAELHALMAGIAGGLADPPPSCPASLCRAAGRRIAVLGAA